MQCYSRTHLSDEALLRDLAAATARERGSTAEVLALIAEVDDRKLYLPAGYSSMYAYCVGVLHLSEDAACKRIAASRAGRQFPDIFRAVAEGRLHLSAVVLLAPHLTEGNADELLAAAEHKTRSEIDRQLAQRFPRPDALAWVEPTFPAPSTPLTDLSAPGRIDPRPPGSPAERGPAAKPLSAQSFAVQFTMSAGAHEHLCYAQELLGHQAASGDIAQVIERALAVYVAHLEKRKLGATPRPRSGRGSSRNPRYIPARVRKAVWERDGGQCSFVSDSGHRCEARKPLEFDHVLEVARGGEATVEGIQLRCRAHNQYTAERTFGGEFMRRKRVEASEFRAAADRARANARAGREAGETVDEKDVVPWLRALGFSAAEAKRGAERCQHMPDASLEDRVRHALSCFRVRGTHVAAPSASAP